MRDNVTIALSHSSLKTRIDLFFVSRGLGVNPYSLRRARLREIIALESQTDAELARQGLTREDILPHVFSDLLN